MKKVFMFCILLFSATIVMPGFAATTPGVVGDSCTLPGGRSPLPDRSSQDEDCNIPEFTGKNGAQCYFYCDNGNLMYVFTACKPGFYLLDKIYVPKLNNAYRRCGILAEACAAAGQQMNDDGTCDCGDMRYEWSESQGKCVDSADFIACEAAAKATNIDLRAHWDRGNGKCDCNDGARFYWNSHTHRCEPMRNQAECDKIKNAQNADSSIKSEAKWNFATSKCECIKDENGEKIQNPDEYEIDEWNNCVKKEWVLRKENAARNAPAANETHTKIKGIIDDLNDISGKIGKSHWKNASGGFNTARLASDSVAGVVLGTVGGVITSNIIKKNQVKGGFEDINCTIGGQRVAGYADEFNVGIQ